jgi:hypothetical protein
MDTSTRADRVAEARRLTDALHRTPGDSPSTGETPRGDCGRDPSEECGMKDENECRTHCGPTDGDPATLGFAGTAAMRREQLRSARRYGLQREMPSPPDIPTDPRRQQHQGNAAQVTFTGDIGFAVPNNEQEQDVV